MLLLALGFQLLICCVNVQLVFAVDAKATAIMGQHYLALIFKVPGPIHPFYENLAVIAM
jgi:hypothetical protein|tara:strand:+ start:3433 stop:3609 length:177 start_codon:yes stop_codon:yes gene_type:complete